MANIMEFIINLLLLKGKFLRETAAEKLHEAIVKWLQFRKKINYDYHQRTSTSATFDNMWEMVNYHAGEYASEENCIVTRNFHGRLGDQMPRIRRHDGLNYNDIWELENRPYRYMKNDSPAHLSHNSTLFGKGAETDDEQLTGKPSRNCLKYSQYRQDLDRKGSPTTDDYLINNLHAILKTQELLFKNISKLILYLEQENRVENHQMEHLKNKLSACTEILSGVRPAFPEAIINDIIEEEVTRCRFRNGYSPTNADMDLRTRKPIGLEIALGSDSPKKQQLISGEKKDVNKPASSPSKIGIDMQSVKKTNVTTGSSVDPPGVISSGKMDPEIVQRANKSADDSTKVMDAYRNNEHFNRKVMDSEVRQRSHFTAERIAPLPSMSITQETVIESVHAQTDEQEEAPFCDSDEQEKLIEMNERHFSKFENKLHQMLTTMKCCSIQDDQAQTRRISVTNKSQLFRLDNSRLRHNHEFEADRENMARMILVNDMMFQLVERKLILGDKDKGNFEEETKREIQMVNWFDNASKQIAENKLTESNKAKEQSISPKPSSSSIDSKSKTPETSQDNLGLTTKLKLLRELSKPYEQKIDTILSKIKSEAFTVKKTDEESFKKLLNLKGLPIIEKTKPLLKGEGRPMKKTDNEPTKRLLNVNIVNAIEKENPSPESDELKTKPIDEESTKRPLNTKLQPVVEKESPLQTRVEKKTTPRRATKQKFVISEPEVKTIRPELKSSKSPRQSPSVESPKTKDFAATPQMTVIVKADKGQGTMLNQQVVKEIEKRKQMSPLAEKREIMKLDLEKRGAIKTIENVVEKRSPNKTGENPVINRFPVKPVENLMEKQTPLKTVENMVEKRPIVKPVENVGENRLQIKDGENQVEKRGPIKAAESLVENRVPIKTPLKTAENIVDKPVPVKTAENLAEPQIPINTTEKQVPIRTTENLVEKQIPIKTTEKQAPIRTTENLVEKQIPIKTTENLVEKQVPIKTTENQVEKQLPIKTTEHLAENQATYSNNQNVLSELLKSQKPTDLPLTLDEANKPESDSIEEDFAEFKMLEIKIPPLTLTRKAYESMSRTRTDAKAKSEPKIMRKNESKFDGGKKIADKRRMPMINIEKDTIYLGDVITQERLNLTETTADRKISAMPEKKKSDLILKSVHIERTKIEEDTKSVPLNEDHKNEQSTPLTLSAEVSENAFASKAPRGQDAIFFTDVVTHELRPKIEKKEEKVSEMQVKPLEAITETKEISNVETKKPVVSEIVKAVQLANEEKAKTIKQGENLEKVLSKMEQPINNLSQDPHVIESKVSQLQRKSNTDTTQKNDKTIDEMETTLKTVTIYVDRNPEPSSSNTGLTQPNDKKRRVDDPSKKNMSTINPVIADSAVKPSSDSKLLAKKEQQSEQKQNVNKETRGFMKSASELTYKKHIALKTPAKNKVVQAQAVETIKKEETFKSHSLLQLRRTTKTAMKKQQVFTILPKIEREKESRKHSIRSKVTVLPDEIIKSIQTEQTEQAKHASTNTPRPKKKTSNNKNNSKGTRNEYP